MSGEEVLLTLGEVAVGVAGCSGIVATLFGGRSDGWSPAESFRVINLVATAVAVALFAFLPFVLKHLHLGDAGVWAISSGALSTFLVIWYGWVITTVRRMGGPQRYEIRVQLGVVSAAAVGGALVLQLLNLSSVMFFCELGPFLAGLVLLLLITLLVFCIMVSVGMRGSRSA